MNPISTFKLNTTRSVSSAKSLFGARAATRWAVPAAGARDGSS
uniref:Uncharacterized protein n=1 Tax=Setaria italica TaxID=4555 RepID=K3YP14_SETIT